MSAIVVTTGESRGYGIRDYRDGLRRDLMRAAKVRLTRARHRPPIRPVPDPLAPYQRPPCWHYTLTLTTGG